MATPSPTTHTSIHHSPLPGIVMTRGNSTDRTRGSTLIPAIVLIIVFGIVSTATLRALTLLSITNVRMSTRTSLYYASVGTVHTIRSEMYYQHLNQLTDWAGTNTTRTVRVRWDDELIDQFSVDVAIVGLDYGRLGITARAERDVSEATAKAVVRYSTPARFSTYWPDGLWMGPGFQDTGEIVSVGDMHEPPGFGGFVRHFDDVMVADGDYIDNPDVETWFMKQDRNQNLEASMGTDWLDDVDQIDALRVQTDIPDVQNPDWADLRGNAAEVYRRNHFPGNPRMIELMFDDSTTPPSIRYRTRNDDPEQISALEADDWGLQNGGWQHLRDQADGEVLMFETFDVVAIRGTYTARMTIATQSDVWVTGDVKRHTPAGGGIPTAILGVIAGDDVYLWLEHRDRTANGQSDATFGLGESPVFQAAMVAKGEFKAAGGPDAARDRVGTLHLSGSYVWGTGSTEFSGQFAYREYFYDPRLRTALPPRYLANNHTRPDFEIGSWDVIVS